VDGEGPEISVEQVSRSRKLDTGIWQVSWRLQNLTDREIEIFSARVPHGKYRSDGIDYHPPIDIGAGQSAEIHMRVACDEGPGSAVENAFLILLAQWSKVKWRIFVRFLVKLDNEGRPATGTASITTQKVGFSGVSD
jgi:hypothetical protein